MRIGAAREIQFTVHLGTSPTGEPGLLMRAVQSSAGDSEHKWLAFVGKAELRQLIEILQIAQFELEQQP